MKHKLQLIFASFLLTFVGIVFNACDNHDWYPEDRDSILTDESHGGLVNYLVVETGEVKNVTHNSATVLFSANLNYKESLGIKPGIKYGDANNYTGWWDFQKHDEKSTYIEVNDFTSSSLEVTLTNLEPSTTYYCCAYGKVNGTEHYGSVKSFTTSFDGSIIDAVDLGLSVKWANMNVGATSEETEGGKFYWGGTEPRKENYKPSWYGYYASTLREKRITDNDDNLYSSYDAATQIWGSKWRMPTKDEFQELIDNCTWEKTKKDGENVYKITGPSGKYIYLPITDYWTSTAYSSSSFYLHLTSSSWGIKYNDRSYIYSIRPVLK